MNNNLMNWGEAYKALCDRIEAQVPAIKHMDLYYEQPHIIDSEDGNWLPFRCPAVFFEFNAAEVNDLGELRQELLMDIGVYLAYETTADSNKGSLGQARALAFIQLLRDLHAALHDHEGTHFGPLSRISLQRVPAPPTMIVYRQVYRAHMLDYSATKTYVEQDTPPLAIDSPADAPPVDSEPLFRIGP